jgi:hypothetical protein
MRRQSPIEVYRSWKRVRADVGCVFARYMAANPERFGQRAAAVRGRDPGRIAASVAGRISVLVQDPDVAAATLVLPQVSNLGTLTEVALALGSQPQWTVTLRPLLATPIGDLVALNLVRQIPMEGGVSCPSEMLALGPFAEFPNTRRAPVVALEMFVGTAPTCQRDGKPTVRAHLADVVIDGPAKAIFNGMWERTKSERLRSLGGVDDPRAKAKVSLVIPMDLAKSLGCVT